MSITYLDKSPLSHGYFEKPKKKIAYYVNYQAQIGNSVCTIPIYDLYSEETYLRNIFSVVDRKREFDYLKQLGIKLWLEKNGYKFQACETRRVIGRKSVLIKHGEWQYPMLYLIISWDNTANKLKIE